MRNKARIVAALKRSRALKARLRDLDVISLRLRVEFLQLEVEKQDLKRRLRELRRSAS